MTHTKKKLTLDRESVRRLTRSEMAGAAGGTDTLFGCAAIIVTVAAATIVIRAHARE